MEGSQFCFIKIFETQKANGHLQPYYENLTGTRGAYRPYNTVAPKLNGWEPQIKTRQ